MLTKVHNLKLKWSKFKNFWAHHEANNELIVLSTENVQKSHLWPKLWAIEKSSPKSDLF